MQKKKLKENWFALYGNNFQTYFKCVQPDDSDIYKIISVSAKCFIILMPLKMVSN